MNLQPCDTIAWIYINLTACVWNVFFVWRKWERRVIWCSEPTETSAQLCVTFYLNSSLLTQISVTYCQACDVVKWVWMGWGWKTQCVESGSKTKRVIQPYANFDFLWRLFSNIRDCCRINLKLHFKGVLCRFKEDDKLCCNIYNIDEVIIQTPIWFFYLINKLLFEENKVPRTLFEVWKMAGSATYKQSQWLMKVMKLCCPSRLAGLFSQECYWGIKKRYIFSLIIFSPQNYILAPLSIIIKQYCCLHAGAFLLTFHSLDYLNHIISFWCLQGLWVTPSHRGLCVGLCHPSLCPGGVSNPRRHHFTLSYSASRLS